jgi:hypothetical protein
VRSDGTSCFTCRHSPNPAIGAGTPEACKPSSPWGCGVHGRLGGTRPMAPGGCPEKW